MANSVVWKPLSHVWADRRLQRKAFNKIAHKERIKHLDDWYRCSKKDVVKHGASAIINLYNNSLFDTLNTIYPHHEWLPWAFKCAPMNHWSSVDNQRSKFNNIAECLNIKHLDDWYKVTTASIREHGASSILVRYDNSLRSCLTKIYPEHMWLDWRFAHSKDDYWFDLSNQRDKFNSLGENLNIKHLDEWYESIIVYKFIITRESSPILSLYNNSISLALQYIYPQHAWSTVKFKNASRAYWSDLDRQRKLFEELSVKLDIEDMEEWYSVTASDIIKSGGADILYHYNNDLGTCLSALYPEHSWAVWRLKRVEENPIDKTQVIENVGKLLNIKHLDQWYNVDVDKFARFDSSKMIGHRYNNMCEMLSDVYPQHEWILAKFFSWQQNLINKIAECLGIKHLDDWYYISINEFTSHSGGRLLRTYGSIFASLRNVFPEHGFVSWRFIHTHKQRLDAAAKHLGIKDLEGWYNVKRRDLVSCKDILNYYDGSLLSWINYCYPDYDWVEWRFRQYGVSSKQSEQKNFLLKAKESLNITSPEMWYRISARQIVSLGGSTIMKYWPRVLKSIEPEFNWNWNNFSMMNKKHAKQRSLLMTLCSIFPDDDVIEEAPIQLRESTHMAVVVDIYIPQHNLAFEYQGEQHYEDVFKWQTEVQNARDVEKHRRCAEAGICLVPIPYWWEEGDVGSIVATIKHYNPNLLQGVPCGREPLLEQTQFNKQSSLMGATQAVLAS